MVILSTLLKSSIDMDILLPINTIIGIEKDLKTLEYQRKKILVKNNHYFISLPFKGILNVQVYLMLF